MFRPRLFAGSCFGRGRRLVGCLYDYEGSRGGGVLGNGGSSDGDRHFLYAGSDVEELIGKICFFFGFLAFLSPGICVGRLNCIERCAVVSPIISRLGTGKERGRQSVRYLRLMGGASPGQA